MDHRSRFEFCLISSQLPLDSTLFAYLTYSGAHFGANRAWYVLQSPTNSTFSPPPFSLDFLTQIPLSLPLANDVTLPITPKIASTKKLPLSSSNKSDKSKKRIKTPKPFYHLRSHAKPRPSYFDWSSAAESPLLHSSCQPESEPKVRKRTSLPSTSSPPVSTSKSLPPPSKRADRECSSPYVPPPQAPTIPPLMKPTPPDFSSSPLNPPSLALATHSNPSLPSTALVEKVKPVRTPKRTPRLPPKGKKTVPQIHSTLPPPKIIPTLIHVEKSKENQENTPHLDFSAATPTQSTPGRRGSNRKIVSSRRFTDFIDIILPKPKKPKTLAHHTVSPPLPLSFEGLGDNTLFDAPFSTFPGPPPAPLPSHQSTHLFTQNQDEPPIFIPPEKLLPSHFPFPLAPTFFPLHPDAQPLNNDSHVFFPTYQGFTCPASCYVARLFAAQNMANSPSQVVFSHQYQVDCADDFEQ